MRDAGGLLDGTSYVAADMYIRRIISSPLISSWTGTLSNNLWYEIINDPVCHLYEINLNKT